ncbi:MAG: SUMF1/EgtB/PvdO family nonheme iron enzyme [Myxococcales bacterium]|nr:SUMF1/EgtB/PvdO family nonheme iron enzyme [Myxococcales bacterium]
MIVVPDPPPAPSPRLLYLPDGGDKAPPEAPALAPQLGMPQLGSVSRCPAEMVDIRGKYCIDRYEAQLVDSLKERALSPFYSPEARKAKREFGYWQKHALEVGSEQARSKPLPLLPGWQLTEHYEPKAMSAQGVLPNGYLTAHDAEKACRNVGKRLCTEEEWVTACKGEQQRQFPYGDKYQPGTCNVFREAHPAHVLHDDASRGHLDPRLNQVSSSAGPLLRKTGATPECRSRWGNDAVYDMVGNLDEWIDDPGGVFVGGFFSRSTKNGCLASVHAHPPEYYDYSLGVRCCFSQVP